MLVTTPCTKMLILHIVVNHVMMCLWIQSLNCIHYPTQVSNRAWRLCGNMYTWWKYKPFMILFQQLFDFCKFCIVFCNGPLSLAKNCRIGKEYRITYRKKGHTWKWKLNKYLVWTKVIQAGKKYHNLRLELIKLTHLL